MAGYQLMVAEEIFRGHYRQSWEKPAAMTPNKAAEYTVDLRGNDYAFRKGHRIMVQVQSTWFPLYDRNPQTVSFAHKCFGCRKIIDAWLKSSRVDE